WLAASDRSAGRRYGDVAWLLADPMPEEVRGLTVERPIPGLAPHLVFSALDAAAAADLEHAFAAAGHVVVSNARTHRLDADVPLLVPEINADHVSLLTTQRRERRFSGAIVTNPNCSTVFLAMVLAACRPFRPTRTIVTTLQAASGAGHPGVASWDLLGNVVPFIDGEEEKIETETPKILGSVGASGVIPYPVSISAQATRVPVLDGHTESISVAFEDVPSQEDLLAALSGFSGRPQDIGLPSAPRRPIVYLAERDRPQPRADVGREGGMAVSVGRVRRCPVLDYKLVALGHNTVRGAAGAAILNAELLAADGWLVDGVTPW
ncbi:MAG: aspartate-semialdehyde dehydrogenase, partial [Acidobacteria bacterium]|nr:aspartate-semialdehyde dehydrogenase [Acidobacteriota bacterium]